MNKKNNAKKFLNHIKNYDNILIIHHTDLDGIASGILLYDYCKKKTNSVSELAYDHGDKFNFKKNKYFDKVIFVDLADNSVIHIIKYFLKQNKEILFIDHHPKNLELPKETIIYYNKNKKYYPCSRMVQEITNDKLWLGVAGTLSDYGNKYKENNRYINDFLKSEKIELDWFLKNVVFTLSNSISYFNKKYKKIFNLIKNVNDFRDLKKFNTYSIKIEKEINKIYKKYPKEKENIGIFKYFFIKTKYPIKGIVISKLSSEFPSEIFIFLGPNFRDKNKLFVSSRTQNDNINLSKILQKCINDFEDSSYGGHKRASGGYFPKKYLSEFKNRLKRIKI